MSVLVLFVAALAVCFALLLAHGLRRRLGPAPFFALLGGLTSIMAWVTDAGLRGSLGSMTFMVGSTVFYTALMVGVFVVYVFDGPGPARVAIVSVAVLSAVTPAVSALLHLRGGMLEGSLQQIPDSGLRINAASVATTLVDMVAMGVAWECLGRPVFRMPLWARTFITLLGVMCLDAVVFTTAAFYGSPAWMGILQGSLINRGLVALVVFPLLFAYLRWESRQPGMAIENRPVLAILRQVEVLGVELKTACEEIRRRKDAEAERDHVILDLQRALSEVKTLRGFIPICSSCKKIREDDGYWRRLEEYIGAHSEAAFTHSICPDCERTMYPEIAQWDAKSRAKGTLAGDERPDTGERT